jgi:hypothetical protein
VIIDFPKNPLSPEEMLKKIITAHENNLGEVLVIGFDKDGEEILYTTSIDVDFLAKAQLSVQSLAIHAKRGEVDYE